MYIKYTNSRMFKKDITKRCFCQKKSHNPYHNALVCLRGVWVMTSKSMLQKYQSAACKVKYKVFR